MLIVPQIGTYVSYVYYIITVKIIYILSLSVNNKLVKNFMLISKFNNLFIKRFLCSTVRNAIVCQKFETEIFLEKKYFICAKATIIYKK